MDNTHQNTTTPLQLALAWGFVGITLEIGVIQTLINSMQLFRKQEGPRLRCRKCRCRSMSLKKRRPREPRGRRFAWEGDEAIGLGIWHARR